jgi:hypothetical protein
VTDAAKLLSARYIAIRTAEAKGLTDRLVQASRDKSPEVRRILAPLVVRFWRNNHEEGWALLERIAQGCVRFPGLPNLEVMELFGTASVGILNEVRHEPENLARLGGVWRRTLDRLLKSPLALGFRVLGRGWALRRIAGSAASALKKQPPYQPLNYVELQATFARPEDFRAQWRQALGCLEHPESAPGPIVEILSNKDLPFDLYLMLVCERALIYYGVHAGPSAAMGVLEHIFRHGAPWFRQSILYALLHVLTACRAVDVDIQARYDALALDLYRSESWRLHTDAGSYEFANQVAYADAAAARANRAPRVLPQLLDAAIAAKDDHQIAALFHAIDGLAFSLGEGALALSMIEHAYVAGGELVEPRVIASLASVRLLDQPLVDTFVQQHTSFARIPLDILAGAEPSVRGEDMNSLVDQFVIEMMLNSNDFRVQICRAFSRALTVRTVDEFLAQILQWIRDELTRLPAP